MTKLLTPITRDITQERLHAYAGASGDHNPIHIDVAYAAATPFGGTIAHGMLVLALIAEMMNAAHGSAWRGGGTLKVRFKAPARPGDTLSASGERTDHRDGMAIYAVRCLNQGGEVLVEGRASVPLP